LLSNYTYFKNYYQGEQYSKVINLTQLSVSKKIKLAKRWNWMSEITLQQTDLAAPIKVPFLFTRNRIAYEGKFFKNLILSSGIEARYYSAYKANNYSPLISQFTLQDSVTIKNLPDINLFVHFRIRSFAGYLRAENLNTASFKNGFGWTHNNFSVYKSVFSDFVVPYKKTQDQYLPWHSDPTEAHKICGSPATPILYKGLLYKCPPVANIIDITGDNWFDYHAVGAHDNLNEFVQNIGRPESVCGQCPDRTQAVVINHFDKENVIVRHKNIS
jgi:hypothetical protein